MLRLRPYSSDPNPWPACVARRRLGGVVTRRKSDSQPRHQARGIAMTARDNLSRGYHKIDTLHAANTVDEIREIAQQLMHYGCTDYEMASVVGLDVSSARRLITGKVPVWPPTPAATIPTTIATTVLSRRYLAHGLDDPRATRRPRSPVDPMVSPTTEAARPKKSRCEPARRAFTQLGSIPSRNRHCAPAALSVKAILRGGRWDRASETWIRGRSPAFASMNDLRAIGISADPHGAVEQRVACPRCAKGSRDTALGVNVELIGRCLGATGARV